MKHVRIMGCLPEKGDKLKRWSEFGLIERFLLIFVGTDPAKCNAQAARCTGGVKANGWDRISSEP